MKIMFICTGNICRSAMAEAMLRKMAKEQKKDIEVYSCGIFADDGDIPTEDAIQTMKQYGIELKNHRATHIHHSHIEEMDLILCATLSHKNSVLQLYPNLAGKVFTLKEYVGIKDEMGGIDIKDPWGYDFKVYQSCAKEIEECLESLMKKI